MSEATEKTGSVYADVFAGAGLGILLGTILGLSVTPVVAGVVGALTSLLAIFLGLDAKSAVSKLPTLNAVRIGAFGFATVLGLGLGLHVRINNPIATDPSVAIAKWDAALPDNPTLARQMMVFERTAILPGRLKFDETTGESEAVTLEASLSGAKQTVLFSDMSDYDACSQLDPGRFASPEDTLAAYGRGDPPSMVTAVATALGGVPEPDRAMAVDLAHSILCEVQMAEEQ